MRHREIGCTATLALFLCSCATYPEPRDCAAIGAGVGAVGGAIGADEFAKSHSDGGAVGIGIATTLAGAAIGYALCTVLGEKPKMPAALPEPAPPLAPEPTPVEPPPAPEPEPYEGCNVPTILEGVAFDTNATSIRPDTARELERVVAGLARCGQKRMRIEAHTDSVGTAAQNERLSELRAESVRDYLVNRGVDPEQLETYGFGERKPIADNSTPAGRARNRRVEIHPLGPR